MNRMLLALMILSVLIFSPAGAEAGAWLGLEMGGGFKAFDPMGDFGGAINNTGLAGELTLGYQFLSNLSIGLGGEFGSYGTQQHGYWLPLVGDFEVETSNDISGVFLYGRSRLARGKLQPYVEGRVGINTFTTTSYLTDEDTGGSTASNKNFSDSSWYGAGGGGLMLGIKESPYKEDGEPIAILFLDLKVIYQMGGTTEYLTEGDVSLVGDVPVYDVKRSGIDMIYYQIGLVMLY